MPLSVHSFLGGFEILAPLGAGGMGEVYRAHDTKLRREVAVKILPADFSRDAERLSRFEREARLLAQVNHPNVASLYGFDESQGQRFLVMELVEGETLAERVARKPIPVEEALPLFRQIAEGLEAAHEKRIVHRDLKPSNIKITPAGQPKILDFGLATFRDEYPLDSFIDSSNSPTATKDTAIGAVIGTAWYMSPEQARGKPVDARTDVWAFGCCLYEALTGRKAFARETAAEVLAAILSEEPPWDDLVTSRGVCNLVRLCLRKDPHHRLHDIADARIRIDEILAAPPPLVTLSKTRSPFLVAAPWALAAAIAIVAGVSQWQTRPAPREVSRAQLTVAPADWLGRATAPGGGSRSLGRTAVALSPDGRQLVYAGGDIEGSRLYVRFIAEDSGRAVPGTEGAESPFFSPDGLWVGFWVDGKLRKLPIDGSQPITICAGIRRLFGASWSRDGTIAFAQNLGGLLQVSADGGTPTALTTLAEGEVTHRLPHFLPNGEAFLYTVRERRGTSGWDEAKLIVQSLRTGERRTLIENAADGRYASTGHVVFARLGSLFAAPFDPSNLQLTGAAIEVVGNVQQAYQATNVGEDSGAGQYSFAENGTLVYSVGPLFETVENSLIWVDRQGNATPLPVPGGRYLFPRLSPDGKRIAVHVEGLNDDVWVIDVERNSLSRLTDEKGTDGYETWAADGSGITYRSEKSGSPGIYEIPADRSGPPERLVDIPQATPTTWSPDGRTLVFLVAAANQPDIWVLERGSEPKPFAQSPFSEKWPALSPDGLWLVFASNRTGRDEIYVTPFPGPGPEYQVSNRSGSEPAWSPNGKELFYRRMNDDSLISMIAVDITTTPTFRAGVFRELFRGTNAEFGQAGPVRNYDVSSDGNSFLMVRTTGPPRDLVTHLNVVFNWFEELKRLVPTN